MTIGIILLNLLHYLYNDIFSLVTDGNKSIHGPGKRPEWAKASKSHNFIELQEQLQLFAVHNL